MYQHLTMKTIRLLLGLFILLSLAFPAFAAKPEPKPKSKLDVVLKRDKLNCGVRSGTSRKIPGDFFSDTSAQKIGELYCKALAEALLVKVNIIKLTVPGTFEALRDDAVDATFRTMSERLGRDVVDLVNMGEVMFYSTFVAKTADESYPFEQSVAVQVDYIQMNGYLVCVRAGQVQESIAREAGLDDANLFLTDEDVQSYLDGGNCEVNMNATALQTEIGDDASSPWAVTPFSVMTSHEHSDRQWDDLLKYFMGGLRAASRFGIDKDNVDDKIDDPALEPDAKALLGISTNCRGETAGELLGLDGDWMVRAIESVGSYYDMYDASLGHPKLGGLDRVLDDAGLNQVYIDESGRTNGVLVDHAHSPAFTETSFATCDE